MVPIALGLIVAALARHVYRRDTVPDGAVRVLGSVIEVRQRRSQRSGNNRMLEAPVIAYVHPETGQNETYEQTNFGTKGDYSVGDEVEIAYLAETGLVMLANIPRWKGVVAIGGMAVVLIAIGIASLIS